MKNQYVLLEYFCNFIYLFILRNVLAKISVTMPTKKKSKRKSSYVRGSLSIIIFFTYQLIKTRSLVLAK